MDMQPILNNDSKDGMMLSLRNDQFQPLVDRWNAMKGQVEKEIIDLNPLFYELKKHVQHEDDLLRLAVITDYALKENLIIFINKLLDQVSPAKSTTTVSPHTPLNNEALLEEAVALVKALDKHNSKRSQASTHLSFGFLAAFCGIIITILATGLLATFAPAILPAIMVGLFTPLAPIAAAIGLAIASLLFLSAVVASIVHFKKAYNRYNKPAPEGLALALAKALPALAEKVHHGNEEETKRAKINKSRGKLLEFYRMRTQDYGLFKKEGEEYYENRLAFLRGQTTDKPSKVGLLDLKKKLCAENDAEKLQTLKNDLDNLNIEDLRLLITREGLLRKSINQLQERIANTKLVKDHRTDANGQALQGATLKLKDSLKGTLFAEHYDVKHAMKVEAEARAARAAARV